MVPSAVIKGKLDESAEAGRFELLHVAEEIGPMQVRALMEVAV